MKVDKSNTHAAGGGIVVKAVVLDASNNTELASLTIPATAQNTYTNKTLPGISLASGAKVTVLFYLKANANEFTHFDNI